MDLIIRKLSEEHLPMVDAFSCIEIPEMLVQYNAKTRRRIIKHSKETGKIVAYVSLCNDTWKKHRRNFISHLKTARYLPRLERVFIQKWILES